MAFSSHQTLAKLDISSPGKLRAGILSGLEDCPHVSGKNRRLENYMHGLAVMYNLARQKIGLIKEPCVKIRRAQKSL